MIEAIEWELFCALWRERRAAPFAEDDACHPCRRMLVTPAEFTVVSEGREKRKNIANTTVIWTSNTHIDFDDEDGKRDGSDSQASRQVAR